MFDIYMFDFTLFIVLAGGFCCFQLNSAEFYPNLQLVTWNQLNLFELCLQALLGWIQTIL